MTSPQSRTLLAPSELPEPPELPEGFDDGFPAADYLDPLGQQPPVLDADSDIDTATAIEDFWRSSGVSEDLWQSDDDERPGAAPPGTPLTARTGSGPSIRPKRLPRGKLLWIALGVMTGLALLARFLPLGAGAGQTSRDTTGTHRGPAQAQTRSPAPGTRAGVAPGVLPATSATSGPYILLNPGIVRQGATTNVSGGGFGVQTIIDLTVKQQEASPALASTFVQTDKNGAFTAPALTIPQTLGAGTFVVDAQQRNSDNKAAAMGTLASGAPTVKLGVQVGKPGDIIAVALQGFAAGEPIHVFWNSLNTQPLAALQADGAGKVGPAALHVPFGVAGNNTFLFVGANSQSVVAATFDMLTLYPNVALSAYAIQPDNVESFTGSGFGPNERVLIYLDNPNDPPVDVVQADSTGSFTHAGAVTIPFALKGQQTLIFMGEQSRVPDAVNFKILPYAPVVQPSTYGADPGTSVSFFVSAFARNEVVHVYAGHTQSSMGTMIGCFQTDAHGSASAVSAYLIPGTTAAGPLAFALVGAKSGGVGLATVNVAAPPAPVQTAPQPAFTCPLDQQAPAAPAASSSQTPSAAGASQTP